MDAANLAIALVLVLCSATACLASPLGGNGGGGGGSGGVPTHHRRRYRSDGELPRLWIHSKLTAFAAQKPSFSPWSEAPESGLVKPSVLALLANASERAEQAAAAPAAAGAEDKARVRRTAPRAAAATAAAAADDQGDSATPRRRDKLSVCDSVSDWVQMTDAENMWGVRVNLSQSINVGGQVLNQYFYETFCRYDDARPCRGIDALLYTSSCENKYIWAYARVETRSLTEEWTLIKVRGSCSCALYRRPDPLLAESVWDDLRRRRR